MIKFLLNNKTIQTDKPSGSTVLDFVRYHKHLMGTKIGCREGDCGACSILVGDLKDGQLHYQSMTSCLMPLGNAHGKHIVTIEGLNMEHLNPVQKAIVEEGGTQCGFCTVGFVVSLSGYLMDRRPSSYQKAVEAMDGNICRCTGYKSLERAAVKIDQILKEKNTNNPIAWLVEQKFIPTYFLEIEKQLKDLQGDNANGQAHKGTPVFVAGGTDLFVQRPEAMPTADIQHLFDLKKLKFIEEKAGKIVIGAASTAEDIQSSPIIQKAFPKIRAFMKLVSSTPIRNMGTLAGNLVNASPIGDLTIFFLALDSSITLSDNGKKRELKLRDFYKGYKDLDKSKTEYIEAIHFDTPPDGALFNFEKVCKRTHLDIASVNSACTLTMENGKIKTAHVSAGGVGPTPKYLSKTVDFLQGKPISYETIQKANDIIQEEISPISDARGTETYKRLLLRQLFYAHFLEAFPEKLKLAELSN